MRRFVPALVLSLIVLASPAYAAPTPPDATTAAATNIGPLGAQLNGTVTANGHATTVRFQYGTNTKYGSTTAAQPIGQGTSPVPVGAAIGNLKSNTRYHFRVLATSSAWRRAGRFPSCSPWTGNTAAVRRPDRLSGLVPGAAP